MKLPCGRGPNDLYKATHITQSLGCSLTWKFVIFYDLPPTLASMVQRYVIYLS